MILVLGIGYLTLLCIIISCLVTLTSLVIFEKSAWLVLSMMVIIAVLLMYLANFRPQVGLMGADQPMYSIVNTNRFSLTFSL